MAAWQCVAPGPKFPLHVVRLARSTRCAGVPKRAGGCANCHHSVGAFQWPPGRQPRDCYLSGPDSVAQPGGFMVTRKLAISKHVSGALMIELLVAMALLLGAL